GNASSRSFIHVRDQTELRNEVDAAFIAPRAANQGLLAVLNVNTLDFLVVLHEKASQRAQLQTFIKFNANRVHFNCCTMIWESNTNKKAADLEIRDFLLFARLAA